MAATTFRSRRTLSPAGIGILVTAASEDPGEGEAGAQANDERKHDEHRRSDTATGRGIRAALVGHGAVGGVHMVIVSHLWVHLG